MTPLRVIVTGMVGMYPVGGVAWDYLQYVVGLARLGHDVYYHEDTWRWPYHPIEQRCTEIGDYPARYLQDFFARYAPELRERWHYLHLHETSFGMARADFDKVARSADLFINVSGASMIPDQLSSQCVKVFLDTDPGYNQIMLCERFAWSENVKRWCDSVAAHDRHFSYAENIHGADCTIPDAGFAWKTTRMPIVTDLWQPLCRQSAANLTAWTTVMTWNAFQGALTYRSTEYRSKDAEFEKLLDLPARVEAPLKIAVGGENAPLARLESHGWQVADGPQATLTPERYQDFIARSRGEVSPAKHVYVAMRSGWFSCRSACYLAAGRPVIVQDTGFSAYLTTGEGILPFQNLEEAAQGIRTVEADWPRHASAAREIAEDYFGSAKVLKRLIDDAL